MKKSVLGTGSEGQIIFEKLNRLGHQVMIDIHNVNEALVKTGNDSFGRRQFGSWYKDHPDIKINTYSESVHERHNRCYY